MNLGKAQGPASPGDTTLASFLRGLTLGALIGAVIAGSSLWSRHRRRRKNAAPTVE
jgi:hypothetical protein